MSSPPLAGFASAVAIGALDGYAASADTDAGRQWDTPGIGLGGPLVLSWGWAPGVQVGSIILGAGASIAGSQGAREIGDGMLLAGTALAFRALTFKLAQRRAATPARTQGFVRAQALPGDWSHQHHYGLGIDQRPGPVAWAVDQQTGSLA